MGLNDGGFIVVWESYGQDASSLDAREGVYGKQYDSNGVAVTNEFQINTYTDGSQGSASVTKLTNGGFVVTWTSQNQDLSNYGIYGQRFQVLDSTQYLASHDDLIVFLGYDPSAAESHYMNYGYYEGRIWF